MSTGLRQVWNQNALPTDHDAAQAALRQQWGNENIFTSNLVSGLKGYGGSSVLGAANLAEVVGADAAAQGLRRKASSLLMDAQQAGTHHVDMGSVNSLGTFWDSAKANMGQGVGSMAPIIAAAPLGIAPGVLAATAPMYGENIARLERDPTLAGMTPGEKALHAAPTAAVQGAMNYMVPGGVARNLGRSVAAKTGTGVLGTAGITLGAVAGIEGATEAGEEYARQAMHTAANPNRDKTHDTQELIQAGYSGALGGSPIGAMQAAGGYVQDTLGQRQRDTRTLGQRAGDAIADAGGALGQRAGEREGAKIDEALNSLEREAKERGISPREVLAERVEALNKPVDLTAARTEAEAADIVTADYQNKQAMTDQLAEDILMDPEASPAERSVAEAHVAGRQAGAENKHEETALDLNEINEQRDGIMGLVDQIAKAIEPVAGKPAPKNRGSAMKPDEVMRTEADFETMERRELQTNRGGYAKESFFPEELALGQDGVVAGREDILKYNAELANNPRGEVFQPSRRTQEVPEDIVRNRENWYKALFDSLDGKALPQVTQGAVADAPVTTETMAETVVARLSEMALAKLGEVNTEQLNLNTLDRIAMKPRTVAEAMEREEAIQILIRYTSTFADAKLTSVLDKLTGRPRDSMERYARQMVLVNSTNPLRTLAKKDWNQLDTVLRRFVEGAGDAKVRTKLDELFGDPEVTGRVLEMYREGRSGLGKALDVEGTDEVAGLFDDTSSDAITDNDAGFNSGTREFDAPESGVARIRTGVSGKPFFDTHDPDMLTTMMNAREEGLEEVGQIDYIRETTKAGKERRAAEDAAIVYNYNRLPVSINERKQMLDELNARHRTLVKYAPEDTGAKFNKKDISDLRTKTTFHENGKTEPVGDKTTGLLFVEYHGKDKKLSSFATNASRLISRFSEKAGQDELLVGESGELQGARNNQTKLFNGIGMLLESLSEQGHVPTGRIGYRNTPDSDTIWLDPSRVAGGRAANGQESLFQAGVNKATYSFPKDFNIGIGRGNDVSMSSADRQRGRPENKSWIDENDNPADMSALDIEIKLEKISKKVSALRLSQAEMFGKEYKAIKTAKDSLENAKKNEKKALIPAFQRQLTNAENALALARTQSSAYNGLNAAVEGLTARAERLKAEFDKRITGLGADERAQRPNKEVAETEVVTERTVERVYERSLGGKQFSNRALAENDADARQKVTGEPHIVQKRGSKFVVIGTVKERVRETKALSETEEMNANTKEREIRERDGSGEEITKAPKNADGFLNEGEVEKDRRHRADTQKRIEVLEQRGKMKEAAELRATLGGEINPMHRLLASTLGNTDVSAEKAVSNLLSELNKRDVLDQRKAEKLLQENFWDAVGYGPKAKTIEVRAKRALEKLKPAEKIAAEPATTPSKETTLADQLKAYLPLAEGKNKPLAGAITTALKEIAAGRSLKSHEGALAAAKKQFGELNTGRVARGAETAEVTPSQTLPMNFTDGIVWGGVKHNMRPEFAGKSTMDLIKSGDRTATSRNTKPDVKEGDLLRFTDRSGNTAEVRVTKAPYKVSELTAEQWSALEGWEPALHNEYKDAWQFQYELVGKPEAKTTQASRTPEFDKLPSYTEGQKTMTYAGIGSRETPPQVQALMTKYAKRLSELGYTLRSGAAKGADSAFEAGATKKEIFKAADATDQTRAIAKEIHPAPNALGNGIGLNLMARNTNQLFGKNLDTPVDFVVTWTQDGAESSAERSRDTGGTGQAIDMASRKGVPVFNLAKADGRARFEAFMKDRTSSETKRSEQNAQAPNNKADATKRAAELKKAIEEVKRLLGADFDAKAVNELFDPVSGVQWSGEFSPTEMKILIAAGATDAVGTGRHEALHALFKMLKDMGHPQATKVIENLATNPIIMRKLKVLLADEKAALEQLKDPEEAAAYLFQFWMAGQIELGPQAKTFFQQVMKWLDDIQLMLREKVFGSKTATNEREQRRQNELAETLLAHFRDGAMAAPEGRARVQAVLEKNAKAVEARRLNTRAFGHKFHKFMEKGIYSAASIFEDSANPHVKEIGRMFFRLEGDVKGQNQNFLEAAAQMNDQYQVKLRNILTGIDKDTMDLVSKYMNNRTDIKDIHHPEAKAAVEKLRELLKQMFLYQKGRNTARWDEETNSWQLLGEIKDNYYQRVWSIGALTDKQGEFLEKMTKALEKYRRDHKGFPDIEEFDAAKVAQGILNKLINGNGSNGPQETESNIGITPWQASVNKRDLNWLDDVAPGEFLEFLSQDVSEVMTSYIAQATKRAEYSKAFGRGGENLRNKVYEAIAYEMNPELMDKAKAKLEEMLDIHTKGTPPNLVSAMRAVMRAENVPEAEVDKVHADAVARLEPVTKAIMAMEGTLGREIDPNLRHVMSGVTTFQNFRLLPLALFASINDVVGMVARGGSMKDSFQAFARGVREVGMMWKGTYSKDELAKLAESLGTVGAGNYLDSMGQTYSSQFMYGKLRRWNDKLFKWNGLEAWNRAVRIQATGVAIEFIKRHVQKPNEQSKRYLEELFGKDYDTSLVMKDGDLDYSSEAVQQAILSWVNGAVLRPNAAHRPVYASDPHYMLFYHLKQFAYSFHKVILRRTWVEAKEGNYTPAAALFVGYVPVSIAADVMKELLIVGDDDPWWTKGGLTDYLEHGIARANLGGVPQMWLGDTMADPLKIFNNPEGVASRASNVLGPAPDQLIDLLTVPMFDNKSLSRELAGGVPGGVLLRRYVD